MIKKAGLSRLSVFDNHDAYEFKLPAFSIYVTVKLKPC